MARRVDSAHRIAVSDFDGHVRVIKADELRVCMPTRECAQFWVTIVACFFGAGLGVFFMVWGGQASTYFEVGLGLLSVSVGILIPGPDYGKVLPKRSSSRAPTPERESTDPDERREHKHSPRPQRGKSNANYDADDEGDVVIQIPPSPTQDDESQKGDTEIAADALSYLQREESEISPA